MSLSPLSRSVSALMRPTFVLARDQTLGTAASRLRENSTGMLPVVDGVSLAGVIDERSLAAAIAGGAHEIEGVELAFMAESPTIRLYESGAEALRTFEQLGVGSLVVVDDHQRVVGILRASDLIDPPEVAVRPPLVGGMATPFGVYLTSGSVTAGPGSFALVSTGALLFTLITSATLICIPIFNWMVNQQHIPAKFADPFTSMLQLLLFAMVFRLLPIAGVHAAEHMVVHAIERGEPLIPSVVRRMPRVHPRCGTNLAAGISIFLGIALNPMLPEDWRALLALVATILLWKPVGSLVQYWITTRPPSDRQIEMGIKSAQQLLERQGQVKKVGVTFPQRLWNSGLFHVMTGSLLVAGILTAIAALFPSLHLPF